MLKIYLTGATGQLGSTLKELILKNKIFNLISKKIDLTKIKSTSIFLKKINPDIIINCAGLTDVEECETNKKKAIKLNYIITKNLSDYCFANNKYLIHISTDHLYDTRKKNSKEDNYKIKNFYAKTKYLADIYAKKKNSLILRTNFFGHTKKKKGLLYWLEKSHKKKKIIFLYKNIFFSPIHIKTLCKLIIKIMPKRKIGIYNVGSKNGMSKSNFIKKIIKIKKFKIKYKEINYKNSHVNRPKNMIMNVNKFEKEFLLKMPNLKNEILKLNEK